MILSGVLAPDRMTRKKADKENRIHVTSPKAEPKGRVGVWVQRNPIFRNKNKFKKRKGGREETWHVYQTNTLKILEEMERN